MAGVPAGVGRAALSHLALVFDRELLCMHRDLQASTERSHASAGNRWTSSRHTVLFRDVVKRDIEALCDTSSGPIPSSG